MKVKVIKNELQSNYELDDISQYIGKIFNVIYKYSDGALEIDLSNDRSDTITIYKGEYKIIKEEPNLDELIKEMQEYINKISQLSKKDSIKVLINAGILDENGKLQSQYRKDE